MNAENGIILKYILQLMIVVVVTFFNHNFVNCKATLIVAIKIVSQWLQAGLPVKDGGLG